MTRIQTDRDLRCDRRRAAWRPRPPWRASAGPSGRRCAGRSRACRWSSGTGSASTIRSVRRPRPASPVDRAPQPGLREPQAARGRAGALGELLDHGQQPPAHARRSACRPGLDARSSRRRGSSTSPAGDGPPIKVSRLGYSQGELVEHVGFWYYIFGEGKLENYVRSLPITSQSSHGRATRGSSMTIEVFYPGDRDPDGDAFREFARDWSGRWNRSCPSLAQPTILP